MRKTYHIPTVEIMAMIGEYPMMLAGSKEYWPAPARRAMENRAPAF